jgi:hypothetical protein
MADNRSPSLFEIWQGQFDDSAKYWQSFLSTPTLTTDPSAWWQPIMDQSCSEWSTLWHQGQQALTQWLENWSTVTGCTLQSNVPFGATFPLLEDLSRLNKMVADFMEQSAHSILGGFSALSIGHVSTLTEHIERLEATAADINQHLATIAERFDTSDASVTKQIDVLRDQVQTTQHALTQYLDALSKRLDELEPSDTEKNPSPRPPTRRRPKT